MNKVNHKSNFIACVNKYPNMFTCSADYYEARLISFIVNNDKQVINIKMDVDASMNNSGFEYLQDMGVYLKDSGYLKDFKGENPLYYNINFQFV